MSTAANSKDPPQRGRLMVLFGPGAGRTADFDQEALVGRSPDATVRFPDPDVSRNHAAIRRNPDGSFSVHDLGSRNGTQVNGVRVEEGRLEYGDRIQVGMRSILVFSYAEDREDDILHDQRLESLGQLAGAAVHDLNNFLGAIVCAVDFVRRRSSDLEDEAASALEGARRAAIDASTLSRQILGMARRAPVRSAPLDLAGVAREIVTLFTRTLEPTIAIEAEIEGRLVVVGDRTRLAQLILNLLVNARDAMPEGGTLRVSSSPTTVDDALAARHATLFPGDYVLLSIADTGIGMDAEARRRAYEPFFTTKSGGTGLGLATALTIVRSHGGHIDLLSKVGQGTEFRIYLPTAEDAVVPRRTSSGPLTVAGDEQRTILVADSSPVALASVRRLLELLGFEVCAAATATEAVELCGQKQTALVLLDLPNPDRATRAMLRVDKNLRIVRIIGNEDERHSAPEELTLCKPFGLDALASVVASALES